MQNKIFFTGIIASLVLGFSLNALANMNMKINNLCNINSKYWEVEIHNPPGGYIENIAGDGSFMVPSNVPSGTLLNALINTGTYCADKYPKDQQDCQDSVSESLFSPWTASSDGGVLSVQQVASSKYINCNG